MGKNLYIPIGLTRRWWESNSGRVWLGVETRDKTNRESARIRPSGEQNRICCSSLELGGPYRPAGSSLHRDRSGKSCRRPSSSRERNLRIIVFGKRGEEIVIGSRWGGDRICLNAPDEGRARQRSWIARVRNSKSDSGSPKGGIRADSRLVISQVSKKIPYTKPKYILHVRQLFDREHIT